jgi:hypothetical protein
VTSQWNEDSGRAQQINTRPAKESKPTDRPVSTVFERLSGLASGLTFRIVSSLYLRMNYFTFSLQGLGISLHRLHLSLSHLVLLSSSVSFAIYVVSHGLFRNAGFINPLKIFIQFLFCSMFLFNEKFRDLCLYCDMTPESRNSGGRAMRP